MRRLLRCDGQLLLRPVAGELRGKDLPLLDLLVSLCCSQIGGRASECTTLAPQEQLENVCSLLHQRKEFVYRQRQAGNIFRNSLSATGNPHKERAEAAAARGAVSPERGSWPDLGWLPPPGLERTSSAEMFENFWCTSVSKIAYSNSPVRHCVPQYSSIAASPARFPRTEDGA